MGVDGIMIEPFFASTDRTPLAWAALELHSWDKTTGFLHTDGRVNYDEYWFTNRTTVTQAIVRYFAADNSGNREQDPIDWSKYDRGQVHGNRANKVYRTGQKSQYSRRRVSLVSIFPLPGMEDFFSVCRALSDGTIEYLSIVGQRLSWGSGIVGYPRMIALYNLLHYVDKDPWFCNREIPFPR